MTLLLIVVIVALLMGGFDSISKKADSIQHKKKTITNIELQDKLYKENFTKIIKDLGRMDSASPLFGKTLIDALTFLFVVYDIPDSRSDEEKESDLEHYNADIAGTKKLWKIQCQVDYSELTLPQRIWLTKTQTPHVEHPDLLFGKPNTVTYVEGFCYPYSANGIAEIYECVSAKLLRHINVLLTIRDLKKQGFNFSSDRRESDWQQLEKRIAKTEEEKKMYPWLYD